MAFTDSGIIEEAITNRISKDLMDEGMGIYGGYSFFIEYKDGKLLVMKENNGRKIPIGVCENVQRASYIIYNSLENRKGHYKKVAELFHGLIKWSNYEKHILGLIYTTGRRQLDSRLDRIGERLAAAS